MLSEKNKTNIRDFVLKVFQAPGGVSFLAETLSRHSGFMASFAEHAVSRSSAFAFLKNTLSKSGVTLLQDVYRLSLGPINMERLKNAKVGIAIDTETDGNDVQSVVDLGMVRFFYDEFGIICIDGEPFSRFRDPGTKIQEGARAVHGISDEDVKGAVIEDEEVLKFIDGVSLFVAHNSDFDRGILERDFPECGFDKVPWSCSLNEVDWNRYGIADKKLELICLRLGFTYPSHRAAPDSLAVVHALHLSDGKGGAFAEMLEKSKRKKVMLCLERVPFELDTLMRSDGLTPQDFLKKNKFRFSKEDGPAGHKCWFKVYDTKAELIEDTPLIRKAYGGAHVEIPIRVVDAYSLYSKRLPGLVKGGFRTAVPHLTIGFDLLHGDASDVPVPELPETEEELLADF